MIHNWSGTMELFIDCVVFWNLLLHFRVVGLMRVTFSVCVLIANCGWDALRFKFVIIIWIQVCGYTCLSSWLET